MIRELLPRVLRGHRLSRDEASAAVRSMVRGEAGPAAIAALLTALAQRGETEDELLGGALALRAEAVEFPPPSGVRLDTAGTGGDDSGSFNISTGAAIVAAACGIAVAKHGNRSVSSRCGSADLLEALGARVELGPAGALRALEETGFAFFYAPRFHPAMRRVAEVRRELGFRTLFNWLGPLSNPAHATHQVVGISDRSRVPGVARVLAALGLCRALVVHGGNGEDELSLQGENLAVEVADGRPQPRTIEAAPLGLAPAPLEALRGGTPAQNAAILRSVLAGEVGPRRDALLLNAAAAVWIAEGAGSLAEAAARAREAIDGGAAARTLERYVALSRIVGDD